MAEFVRKFVSVTIYDFAGLKFLLCRLFLAMQVGVRIKLRLGICCQPLNILQNVRLSISELVKLYSVSQKKTFVLAFHVSSMHRSYFDKTQISLVTDSLCLPWVRNIA